MSLAEIDPNDTEHYRRKKEVRKELETQRRRIQDLQERLYAENKQGLLIVLQAMDTGGKDGTIKHVLQGVNPQGCRVSSFKVPIGRGGEPRLPLALPQERPGEGQDRHLQPLALRGRAGGTRQGPRARGACGGQRYGIINDFERCWSRTASPILKFFLHISKDEQKRRLQSRLDDPDKRWKFSSADIKERACWDDYQAAYEDAINNCSTEHAPWYVIPANKKWYRNLVIARTIADTLEPSTPSSRPPKRVWTRSRSRTSRSARRSRVAYGATDGPIP